MQPQTKPIGRRFSPIDRRVDFLVSGSRLLEQERLVDVLFNKELYPLRGQFLDLVTTADRAVMYRRKYGAQPPSRFFKVFPTVAEEERDALNALFAIYGERLLEKGYSPTSVASALFALYVGSFPVPFLSQGQVNLQGAGQHLQVEPTYGKGIQPLVESTIFAMAHAQNRLAYKQHLAGVVTMEFNRLLESSQDDDARQMKSLLPEVWVPQDFHAVRYREYPRPLRELVMNNFELITTFGLERPALERKVYTVAIKGVAPITMMELYEVHEEDTLTVVVRVSFKGTRAQDLAVMHVDRGIAWSHIYGEAAYTEEQIWSGPILHIAQYVYAALSGSVPNTGALSCNGDAAELEFDFSAFSRPGKTEFTDTGRDRLKNIQSQRFSGLRGTEPMLAWVGTPSVKQQEALKAVLPKMAEYLGVGLLNYARN